MIATEYFSACPHPHPTEVILLDNNAPLRWTSGTMQVYDHDTDDDDTDHDNDYIDHKDDDDNNDSDDEDHYDDDNGDYDSDDDDDLVNEAESV